MGRVALNLLGSAGQGRRDRLGESILGLGKRTRSRGAKDRSEPDGQGKSGLKAPFRCGRPRRRPFGGEPHGGQRPRLEGLGGDIDAIEPIRKPRRGRLRKHPKKLHADKGYDFPRCREALRKRGITL